MPIAWRDLLPSAKVTKEGDDELGIDQFQPQEEGEDAPTGSSAGDAGCPSEESPSDLGAEEKQPDVSQATHRWGSSFFDTGAHAPWCEYPFLVQAKTGLGSFCTLSCTMQ